MRTTTRLKAKVKSKSKARRPLTKLSGKPNVDRLINEWSKGNSKKEFKFDYDQLKDLNEDELLDFLRCTLKYFAINESYYGSEYLRENGTVHSRSNGDDVVLTKTAYMLYRYIFFVYEEYSTNLSILNVHAIANYPHAPKYLRDYWERCAFDYDEARMMFRCLWNEEYMSLID